MDQGFDVESLLVTEFEDTNLEAVSAKSHLSEGEDVEICSPDPEASPSLPVAAPLMAPAAAPAGKKQAAKAKQPARSRATNAAPTAQEEPQRRATRMTATGAPAPATKANRSSRAAAKAQPPRKEDAKKRGRTAVAVPAAEETRGKRRRSSGTAPAPTAPQPKKRKAPAPSAAQRRARTRPTAVEEEEEPVVEVAAPAEPAEPAEEAVLPWLGEPPSAQKSSPPVVRTFGRRNRSPGDETEASVEPESEPEAGGSSGKNKKNKKKNAAAAEADEAAAMEVEEEREEEEPAAAPAARGGRRSNANSRRKGARGSKAARTVTDPLLVADPAVARTPEGPGAVAAVALEASAADEELEPATQEGADAAAVHGGVVDLSAPSSAATEDGAVAAAPAATPAAAARDWIMTALTDAGSRPAADAILRPSLAGAVDFIKSNIEGTITEGSNNSVLVMGARGSGKTLAVERAVRDVASEYNTASDDPLVGVVRLMGWAHADERAAFKEIARQLCGAFALQFARAASLGDNIEFLREVLDGLARAHKVAVFILEDFDVFATRKAKQTLLYCLLDALQTSGVQAVVIGTTVRNDCLDLLEKRVKSRFSHRSVLIELPRAAAPTPAAAGASSPGAVSPGAAAPAEGHREGASEVLAAMLTLPAAFPHAAHAAAHNAAVRTAMALPAAVKALTDLVAFDNSLYTLRNVAQWVAGWAVAAPDGLPARDSVAAACRRVAGPAHEGLEAYISGLSMPELILLVAAARAARRRNGDAINFKMAHKEFVGYCSNGIHPDSYSAGAAAKAWHKLAGLGLVTPATGPAAARVAPGGQFAAMQVVVTPEELREGMRRHELCPSQLRTWATREGGPLTTAEAMF